MKPHHRYWMAFNLVRGIGPARTRLLLDRFSDLETAWQAPLAELVRAGLGPKLAAKVAAFRHKVDLDAVCADLVRKGVEVLCWADPLYPPRLLEIDNPPPVLYVRGVVPSDIWAVGIVGTRRITSYGRQVTVELAEFLARNGITVVSGFARGVDTLAHKTALQAEGKTIGVLGSGVDHIYPPENYRLAEDMIASGRGTLLSDYPVGTPPEGQNFPPRNRIISGLSLASVIIEAGERSGALITANFALEQGREILAVPGNISSPGSAGTNGLISRGAHPYLRPENVLEILDWMRVVKYPDKTREKPAHGIEQDVYQLLQHQAAHMDEISVALQCPVDQIAAVLTVMEIKGLVRQVDSSRYASV